ncbi:GRAM domain-containing protein 2A isoform X2 [Boleophthalmus pectinirostris]|uniref:GRAM domain-containing protein 2A isoform X2 n=1 Tax=Boleophthalmus pectinirostris TaxID=150288 RepID=UPI00242A4EDD|nr:GRAM domain-containing protein 2A isoform X2 [Boleophthalmus pectinirostris]
MKVYSCALLRDILLQGRLYISRHWLCFYANLFGKDIKVAIPVVSVRLVKKHRTAGLVPNGLAITTDTGQKYVFVSLLSRDSVYDVLRRICTHLQVNGKSLSLKQLMEEPALSLDEFPAADEFPVVDEFPSVLKWRKRPSVVTVSSSLPDLLGTSTGSLSSPDAPFTPETPLEELLLPYEPSRTLRSSGSSSCSFPKSGHTLTERRLFSTMALVYGTAAGGAQGCRERSCF